MTVLTDSGDRNSIQEQSPTPLLHRIFEDIVFKNPQGTAVIDDTGVAFSYQALNSRANALAGELREMGVCSEMLVGLCAERGIDAIVGMLGILKAGGAYVPIDPAYPKNRINLILADSSAKLVVATSRLHNMLDGIDARVIFVDDKRKEWTGSARFEPSASHPSNICYVIYTSGSAGLPKGVMVEHRNVSRLFTSHAPNLFACGPNDVWLWFHSIGFDFSVWEIWGALLLGGTLVIASYETTRSPEATVALVRRYGVTVLNQTPSAFRHFSQADLTDTAMSESLRLIIFGGESLDVSLLWPWFERYGDERPMVVNMYGITETTVHVTHRRITQLDAKCGEIESPIGVPLPDLQIHLLDDSMRLADKGVPGEIYVSGPGVARGYIGAPEFNAQRFQTLVVDGKQTRVYRSGDLARCSDSGNYTYLGRVDDQVKVRGFRIEPKEVESVLLKSQAISHCVVRAHDYGESDVRLIAFVVIDLKINQTEEAVRALLTQHVAQHLPAHMRPSDYFFVSDIPLTPHGKVDHAQLQPIRDHASADRRQVPRGDEITNDVAELWLEILGPAAPLEGDFFDVGGTSLALIRLLTRITKRFGVIINPSQLLEGVTISNIVTWIGIAHDHKSVPVEKV